MHRKIKADILKCYKVILLTKDMFDAKKRSEIMSHIRSKNTKGEIMVRKHLHQLGFRFRLHDAKLPGKPDIVLPKYKCVVFIHGCFWHAHQGCKYYSDPKTNAKYWIPKIQQTQKEMSRR